MAVSATADEALATLEAFEGRGGETLFIADIEVDAWLDFARAGTALTLHASFPGPERRSWFTYVRDQQDVVLEDVSARQAKRLVEMLAWGDLSGLAAALGRPW